jgi:hypothetical protein
MTHFETQIPCIVDRGVIFNKKDMIRVLQGLDHVEYNEVVAGKSTFKREGYVIEIFEDPTEATIIFNRRLFLNVNSFEYLKINYNFYSHETPEANQKDSYAIELAMAGRTIVLKPLTDPIDNPTALLSEVEDRRRSVSSWEEVVAEVDDE